MSSPTALVLAYMFVGHVTHDASDNSSFRPLVSKRLFISNSVLNNNNRCLVRINSRGNRLDGCVLIDSFVGTDDVVISLAGFGGSLEYFCRDDSMFPVVLRVHNQALCKVVN